MMDVSRQERNVNPILFLNYRVVESGILSVRETICVLSYLFSFCNTTSTRMDVIAPLERDSVDAKSRPKRIPR